MIRHVGSIAEIVDDFEAAVQFYRDALGLSVKPTPDANYADVVVEGVPHFGIWRRSHAAQIIYGDASATDRVPLGFTIGFEIDSVEDGEARLRQTGAQVRQASHVEPMGESCETRNGSESLLRRYALWPRGTHGRLRVFRQAIPRDPLWTKVRAR